MCPGHANHTAMHYYCNRSKMSARAAGPAAEGCEAGCPRSALRCCGEPVRGDGSSAAAVTVTRAAPAQSSDVGSSVAEAQALREWDSTASTEADRTQNRYQEGFLANGATGITREAELVTRGRFCRQRLPPVRTGRTERCGHGKSEPAVIKRRRCAFTRTSKRASFSGTSSVSYCGSSDAEARVSSNGEARIADTLKPGRQVDTPVKRRASLRRIQCENTVQTSPCLPETGGGHGVENTALPKCRTAKGRVRPHRVRACLSSSANHSSRASGNNDPSRCPQTPRPEHEKQQRPVKTLERAFAISSSCGESAQMKNEPPDGTEEKTSSSTQQMEAVRDEAGWRQAELEGRTDHLWKRLQAIQVKQVERHISQQLHALHRSPRLNCTRRPSVRSCDSVELSRLAHSCSEILRTVESSLDSDHTASSSGGDSEEEDEAPERTHVLRPLSTKSLVAGKEWQWAESRAWLGSRWVWLQTQVSELEYRIRALTELYTHLRQGKVRSGHSYPSITSNTCSSGDFNRKWRTEDTPSALQTAPCPPSSAARVQPLPRQRHHRLIRLGNCTALRSQAVSLQCWCESSAVCVLCADAPPRCSSEREKGVCMRQARLDVSVHPVLSMASDSPLALHCGKPPLGGHHNSVQWTDTLCCLGRRGQGRVGEVRRRLVCPRPPGALPPLFNTPDVPPRVSELPAPSSSPPPSDTPAQAFRRRRAERLFDIDNLVMPQGLAGLGARVQRLQYKEILTPSWRELERPETSSDNNTNLQPSGDELENEEEVEDLSDAVFVGRHAACEGRERSRWGSWARRRRRGRSSSSCQGEGKSSRGLETTCSPDSRQSHFTGDASPRSPGAGAEDLLSQMEDEQQPVLPWERRLFPLQDSELHWLQEEEEAEPDEDPCTASSRCQSTDSGISVGSLELSPRTPQPSHQISGSEQIPHTLFHKPVPVPPAQDSHTLAHSSPVSYL